MELQTATATREVVSFPYQLGTPEQKQNCNPGSKELRRLFNPSTRLEGDNIHG
jgi:hypothetical protein